MCVIGELMGTYIGELSNGSIPDPHVAQTDRLQIGDHRLSTSCGVAERSDHHCGDDLVLNEMYMDSGAKRTEFDSVHIHSCVTIVLP